VASPRCSAAGISRPAVRLLCGFILAALSGASTTANDGRSPAARAQHACGELGRPRHRVVRVEGSKDLLLDDGRTVHLIGALSPRRPPSLPAGAAWPFEQDAKRALNALVAGRQVDLVYSDRRIDRYGRLLAHVFVLPSAATGGDPVWVQGALVSQGHARAYVLPGNTACLDELLALERQARDRRLGLWNTQHFAVRDSANARHLLALRNEFVLVEGQVGSVAPRGARIYLNFGADWRRDFTVAVPMRLVRRRPGLRDHVLGLAGKRVRVRGWIERRNGPLIDIADVREIEIVGGEPSVTPPGP
jgi:endonuclease YncB( thermonuclease family)